MILFFHKVRLVIGYCGSVILVFVYGISTINLFLIEFPLTLSYLTVKIPKYPLVLYLRQSLLCLQGDFYHFVCVD